MRIDFLNPFLLFGLGAVILPILIHRITRKKAVVKRFSAVRLLVRSQRITAKPQRLKHLLLLALRILAVAGVAFMMARPVLVQPGLAALRPSGARVLILDNSLSMGYGDDRGRRFEAARKAAREILAGFEGQVAVIPTAGGPADRSGGWLAPEAAPGAIAALGLDFGAGNAEAAFTAARRLLAGVSVPAQILIFSDMARSDWEGLDLTRLGSMPDADITFLRIGGPERDANWRVQGVRLDDGEMAAGVPARLEATVANLSGQAATRLVQVDLAGVKVAQKAVTLQPGREETLSFDLRVDTPGWVDGAVRLSADRLAADDVFYFPLQVSAPLKVLIVDGDPKTSLRAGESYYLASALRPGEWGGSPFLTRVVTANEAGRMDPDDFDSLFLLNVAKPEPYSLASFLAAGKPVFLFLGDRVDPAAYRQSASIPWRIEGPIGSGERPLKISQIDLSGENFKSLTGLEDSLRGAVFGRYFRIEGAGLPLLVLDNGDPLLATAAVGRSTLYLFASSADIDWNDLPLNAAYLPLVQGLVKQAAGFAHASLPAGVNFGDASARQGQAVQLTGPGGGPGIYRFQTPEGELRRGVNTPPAESDFTKITDAELHKQFGGMALKILDYNTADAADLRGGERALWPLLLGLLLAVLAVESVLANGLLRFER